MQYTVCADLDCIQIPISRKVSLCQENISSCSITEQQRKATMIKPTQCLLKAFEFTLWLFTLPSIPSLSLVGLLLKSYRMYVLKIKLNLWLWLLYANERLACYIWTTETIKILQDSSRMQIVLTSSIYPSVRMKTVRIFTHELTLAESVVSLCTKSSNTRGNGSRLWTT